MKVLVAHPAQQHSYRLATALNRIGYLEKYATTVYYKKGSITSIISKLLKGKFRIKAKSRRCDDLADNQVIQFCEIEGLIKLLALNTRLFKKQYYTIKYHTADRFARKVAKYAIKHNVDAVITYDDTSPILFELLKKKAPGIIRIMDMSSANLLYLRVIYEKDMEIAPAFAERLRKERSICWDPVILDRAKREIDSTQVFLVPSKFVARSLEFSGVNPDQMIRCPYGVDVDEFIPKSAPVQFYMRSRPIKFIYVGGVKELKGISYLLDAFKEISPDCASLTVVGQYDPMDKDIQEYMKYVNFIGSVLHSEIPPLLQDSDVFVFPSLGDSYSLAVMEAAACGLPVIVSENTGVQDLIVEGVNGFIVPIQSKDALKEKIQFFIDHPEKIKPMGQAARKTAEENTWDIYYESFREIAPKLGGGDAIECTLKDYNFNKPYKQRAIHFIYTGGVKELKGISYLLDAFISIDPNVADLTVIGDYNENDADIKAYKDTVRFTGRILHSAVATELRRADVFVFPSLGEGLSLSTLEAMACGLPLIVTDNSGVNDEMVEGVQGFIIPIQSKQAIIDKVLWFVDNPEEIKRMGDAARSFALQYTWERYYDSIDRIFRSI